MKKKSRLRRRYGRAHPFARGDEYPYRIEFSTAHGLIRGWIWATSVRQAKVRLDDELGGAWHKVQSIQVDPSGYAPRPSEHEHSKGSKYFARDLRRVT